MHKDEKKQQQKILASANQKSWGDLLLESWMKPAEDFGSSKPQPEEPKKDINPNGLR